MASFIKKLRRFSLSSEKKNKVKQKKYRIQDYFNVIKPIGEGGYGKAYLVLDKYTGEPFALKEINLKRANKKFIENELEFLEMLNNPNLIEYYGNYRFDDFIYLVIQYCQGGELFDLIKRKGKFTELESKIIMYQLLKGVEYMHSVGIMHRDLKPENILLVRKRDISDIRIIDFGLSIKIEENNNSRIGTSYYMAPEVINRDYTSKCDNWSLGVIMFILIYGYPPFSGDTDEDILVEIVNSYLHELPYPSKKTDLTSKYAKNLINRLLTYDPSIRISIKDALNHKWFKGFNPDEFIKKYDSLPNTS